MHVALIERENHGRSVRADLEQEGFCVRALDGAQHLSSLSADIAVFNIGAWGEDAPALLGSIPSDLPTLILSPRVTIEATIDALDRGADDVVTQPVQAEELAARVRMLVCRANGHSSPVIRIGNLEVDTISKATRVSGYRVAPTSTEYALLELLALRPGRPISKQVMLDRLSWIGGSSRLKSIDVYLCGLRKKLEFGCRGNPRLRCAQLLGAFLEVAQETEVAYGGCASV